ncbi:MAG: DALR domain-containing protein, partial [Candidatus Methanoperedens sp.]
RGASPGQNRSVDWRPFGLNPIPSPFHRKDESKNPAGGRFETEMDNDLNTPGALASIFDMVGEVNAAIEKEDLSAENAKAVYELMLKFNAVLGILTLKEKGVLSGNIEALIEEREKARERKNFKHADEIRKRLEDMGIVLEDTKEGVKWRKK